MEIYSNSNASAKRLAHTNQKHCVTKIVTMMCCRVKHENDSILPKQPTLLHIMLLPSILVIDSDADRAEQRQARMRCRNLGVSLPDQASERNRIRAVLSMDGYGWTHCFAICRETPNFTAKQLIHHPAQHRISQDNGQTEEPEWATLLLVSVSVSSFFTPLASDPPPDTRLEKLETAACFALKI